MSSINLDSDEAPVEVSAFQLKFLDNHHAGRPAVESFIHNVFKRAYGANVSHFLPQLMSLRHEQASILAALGLREASRERLFLETYLDDPVESVLSRLQGGLVGREQIVEVGNLASTHRNGLRHLIIAMTAYLSGVGIEWAVFTAVPAVHKAFTALGLNLHPLATADSSRLGDVRQQWGSYYEAGPLVLAGRVQEAFLCLRETIYTQPEQKLSLYLWEQAYVEGFRQRMTSALPVPRLAIGGAA